MGERWVTQTRDARAMRGAIASTIYDCKGLAARFWHGQSTRAERSYGRVHEHANILRTGAALDMMHFDDREVARSTFAEHHLEEVARDNSLRRGDGRWRGHHSVDPSERRTERTFGSTGPGRAKLERGGVNLDHFGEEIRFENDSVLLAMVGIIATRAESAEAA